MNKKGAKPYVPGYNFINKECFINKNDDITGTKTQPLYKNINKVSF